MGQLLLKDNAASTLAVSLSAVAGSGQTVTIASGGAKFPTITGTDWSFITIFDGAGNIESMRVTAHASGSDSFTVSRGTAAGITGVTDADVKAWAAGTSTGVACRPIAQIVQDISDSAISAAASAAASAADSATAVTAVGNHLVDTSAAHAASAISYAGSANLVATDVEAALDELDAEKQPINTTLTAISNGSLGAFSNRNKVRNGGFAINQRGYVSGAAVGTGLYGHDRWKMAASADTYTFSTTNNKTTVTIPAGKVLRQVIEGLDLQTGTYVLSWEGTAQGKIGAGSYGDSGITGSITGGTNTTIEFGPGTVANVQLEPGSVATPFESRPYGLELALCQRYYETGEFWQGGTASVGTAEVYSLSFATIKRAAPTLGYSVNLAVNVSAYDVRTPTLTGLVVYSTVVSGGGYVWSGAFTATAEL